jgi:phenylpropionate dioxygenase-like ring-hydroxylating dioxygenase large terminal subunit
MERQQQVLDALIEHIQNNTTDLADSELRVPIQHFTSSERAAQEVSVIRRKPLVVAHHSELSEPGSFVTRDVLGTSLRLVRQRDGSVRACFEPLDRVSQGLDQVRVEERHGFIWATLDPDDDTPSVEEYLGADMEHRLSGFNYTNSLMVMEKRFTLPVNWKIVMDGARDTLHPKFLHPYGVGKLISTNTAVVENSGPHQQHFTPRMRMEKKVEEGRIDEIDGFFRNVGSSIFLFPNVAAAITPDHVEFWTVWPTMGNPSESTIKIWFLADPDTLDDRMRERINRSWEILEDAAVNEDFPMEESIQRNAQMVPDGAYIYGRNEAPIQHLHRQLGALIDSAEHSSEELATH